MQGVKYLGYLEEDVKAFYKDYTNGTADANYYKKLIDNLKSF